MNEWIDLFSNFSITVFRRCQLTQWRGYQCLISLLCVTTSWVWRQTTGASPPRSPSIWPVTVLRSDSLITMIWFLIQTLLYLAIKCPFKPGCSGIELSSMGIGAQVTHSDQREGRASVSPGSGNFLDLESVLFLGVHLLLVHVCCSKRKWWKWMAVRVKEKWKVRYVVVNTKKERESRLDRRLELDLTWTEEDIAVLSNYSTARLLLFYYKHWKLDSRYPRWLYQMPEGRAACFTC